MAIHKTLPDAEIHEPKGMQPLTGGAGDVGKVNVSKGDGTSETRKLSRNELSDTFEYYGQQAITNNLTPLALTAAVDPTLKTNTDYIQVTGLFDAIPHGENNGVTQSADSLTIVQDGIYRVDLWESAFASNNSVKIAFKFAVDGAITLQRRPTDFLRNLNETHSLAAYGFVQLSAGQVLSLWIASDTTTSLTIEDAVLALTLMRAL